MPMAGGVAMSQTWMPMPGGTWAGSAASFVATWTVMMVAMMLPSLIPTLNRYRLAIGRFGGTRSGVLTALVALGYFAVWSALGVIVFPLGAALAVVEQRLAALAGAAPIATGVVVLIAGAAQLTAWKARHLAWDRDGLARARTMSADAGAAWRHGLCLGVHCTYCCAGLTATLLALGVMDLRVMAVVTAAITAERLAPAGARVARAIGVVGIVTGTLLIARAIGSG
jgi:predicted metal-binding membrane protein